jgi:hypothetical protein
MKNCCKVVQLCATPCWRRQADRPSSMHPYKGTLAQRATGRHLLQPDQVPCLAATCWLHTYRTGGGELYRLYMSAKPLSSDGDIRDAEKDSALCSYGGDGTIDH